MKRFSLLFAVLGLSLLLAACGGTPATPAPTSTPLTACEGELTSLPCEVKASDGTRLGFVTSQSINIFFWPENADNQSVSLHGVQDEVIRLPDGRVFVVGFNVTTRTFEVLETSSVSTHAP